MKVTVFGASGMIGRSVVVELIRAGHHVTVVVRDPARLPPEAAGMVTSVRGELLDGAALDSALAGADAVIWAVGPVSNSPDQPGFFEAAARALVEAMSRHGVRRLVALSGAAVAMPGDRATLPQRLFSRALRLALRNVVGSKERERDVFSASSLDWTLVRPGRVVAGTRDRPAELGPALRSNQVGSSELAASMVGLLEADGLRYVGEAPFLS